MRVPRAIVSRVIELAHRIDSGEIIELDTQSKPEDSDGAIKSKTINNEIITELNKESEKLKSDFFTKSILSYSQAMMIVLV